MSHENLETFLIDTHAHLDCPEFDHDRAEVISRASTQRIGVVTMGVDLKSSQVAVELARMNQLIWAGVGVHPHEATSFDSSVEQKLGEIAAEDKVVAIGEIGLDYYRDFSPRQTQRQVFIRQIALANQLKLPVIIHNRESTEDMLNLLRKHRPSRGVIHSFLGDIKLAQQFLEIDLFLGIGGPLTFKKNDILRSAVSQIPIERIVIETDSPYLTPVPYRGKRNEPAYVRYVANQLAQLKGMSLQEVAKITRRTACGLFNI